MADDNKVTSYDSDPIETQEWLEALDSIVNYESTDRAKFILRELLKHAEQLGVTAESEGINTPYVNTISAANRPSLPDNAKLMERLIHFMRWNALAMVMRAGRKKLNLGGHISSYASIATLYEVGLNYFFRGPNHSANDGGDLVFFQGHSAEGIYARALLEGRIDEVMLDNFRQEALTPGLSSYPHPHLMPDFWQFPTVSLGLGPIMAVYQAQFLKYLHNRQLKDTSQQKVWAFAGDGEMGEPESNAVLLTASREKLDNLICVINCNLQRLDGPVSGNGNVIQELEGVFRGAGWRVIKVIWGSNWESLFAKDKQGWLSKRMSELVDGEYQAITAKDGAYMREHFFGKYPQLLELVADMTDEQLKSLADGGHDSAQVYAAYAEAVKNCGKPTVILCKTIKGFGYGHEGEGLNITHNLEGLSEEGLHAFRDRFNLPLTDEQVARLDYCTLPEDSAEIKFLQQQRQELGGVLPARSAQCESLAVPALSVFENLLKGTGDRAISTGMGFGRIMMALLKDKNIKDRIVPIVADEARTLSLEGLFRQVGIYSVVGQDYTPEDRQQLVYYKEETSGQVLQQGICEAGAFASWIAAGTSYANHHLAMIPFYTYYAMFGYQRIGDLVWAAGDIQARGFIMGGLAGRTTLAGEGLQHQDSHNLLMFGLVPSCIAYDPAFVYELAVIIQDGLRRMYYEQENVFYYITLMNENYVQPSMPEGVEEGIIKGLYCFQPASNDSADRVQLIGSGAILREVIKAQQILADDYQVAADVWSATSFNELRRDIESTSRHNRLHPQQPQQSYVENCFAQKEGPIIAATDYVKLHAEQIRQALKQPYYVLGTDGYGRSDSRPALRDFFEVDAKMIAYTALVALAKQGSSARVNMDMVEKARTQLAIDIDRVDPWQL